MWQAVELRARVKNRSLVDSVGILAPSLLVCP